MGEGEGATKEGHNIEPTNHAVSMRQAFVFGSSRAPQVSAIHELFGTS